MSSPTPKLPKSITKPEFLDLKTKINEACSDTDFGQIETLLKDVYSVNPNTLALAKLYNDALIYRGYGRNSKMMMNIPHMEMFIALRSAASAVMRYDDAKRRYACSAYAAVQQRPNFNWQQDYYDVASKVVAIEDVFLRGRYVDYFKREIFSILSAYHPKLNLRELGMSELTHDVYQTDKDVVMG